MIGPQTLFARPAQGIFVNVYRVSGEMGRSKSRCFQGGVLQNAMQDNFQVSRGVDVWSSYNHHVEE